MNLSKDPCKDFALKLSVSMVLKLKNNLQVIFI